MKEKVGHGSISSHLHVPQRQLTAFSGCSQTACTQHCRARFLQHTLGQACIYTNYISRDLIWLQIVPEINGAHSAVSYWNKAKTTKKTRPRTAAVRLTVSEVALHFAKHMSLCRCICDQFFKGRTGKSGSLTWSLILPQWLTHQEADGPCSSTTGLSSAITHLKTAVSNLQFSSLSHFHLIISQFSLTLGHLGKPISAPAACSLHPNTHSLCVEPRHYFKRVRIEGTWAGQGRWAMSTVNKKAKLWMLPLKNMGLEQQPT